MSKVLGTTFLIHIFKTEKTKVLNSYNISSLSYPLCTPSFDSTINFAIVKRPSLTQNQEFDSLTVFECYSHKTHHKLLRHITCIKQTHTFTSTNKQKNPTTAFFSVTLCILITLIPFHPLGFFFIQDFVPPHFILQ